MPTDTDISIDGPWTMAGITVRCTGAAPAELVDQFWPLYEESFGPLRTLAAARQVLTPEEFSEEMRDGRIWKYVAYDEDGQMIGLTTMTDTLEAVPWISPEYFRHKYPEHAARNAIFYLGITLVKPSMRNRAVFFAMLRPAVQRVVLRRGVGFYDVCGYNDTTFSFGEGIERLLHRLAKVEVSTVDVQTYYGVEFGDLIGVGARR